MSSALNDPTVIEHHDLVRTTDRRKTVGDDKGGSTDHEALECILHEPLTFAVERTGGFIENENSRIF